MTTQDIVDRLVAADTALTAQYAMAPREVRSLITRCTNAIDSAVSTIIAADISTRTKKLTQLTATIKGATEELKEIQKTVNAVSAAGKAAQQVLGTLTSLLPLV